jgi:SAM-dependent methyltransferase
MSSRLKQMLKGLTPPLVWSLARAAVPRRAARPQAGAQAHPDKQALDIYWDPQMAELLETWGEGNAWHEIRIIFAGRRGRALDIACGTGRVMAIVQTAPGIEVHGCDISDLLIARAVERGLDPARLKVCDATRMPYADDSFDFAYSIGSLEHFTEEGIEQVLRGCKRVVNGPSFHMIPVSRSGADEGWIKPYQEYFNNSGAWWVERARRVFADVTLVDSIWSDERSVGKWLVCRRG